MGEWVARPLVARVSSSLKRQERGILSFLVRCSSALTTSLLNERVETHIIYIPLGASVSLMSIHKYCHIFNLQIFDSFVCKAVYSDWYTRVHHLDTCSGYKS